MRNLLISLLLLATTSNLWSQSFYQIDWEADRPYTALVAYYDENQIDVRVKYIDDAGIYRVAKYVCDGIVDLDEDNRAYYFFDGHDAQVVYSADGSPSTYVADNFMFMNLNENNVFENLFTIDDAGLEQEDISDYLVEATYRLLDPQVDFNEQFIFDFFEKNEPEYARYLGLVNTTPTADPPSEQPANPTTEAAKPVLHLVMVADVEDRSIGNSTAQDQKDVTTTFTKISRELGIDIKEYQLSGQTFNKDAILGQLNSINNSSNDIIIYYYSGHGYSNTQVNSDFPTMALDGTDAGLEEIFQEVRNKNARLTLIIGDMCNSLPESRRAVGRREALPFKSGYLFDNNKLNKLFVESSGFVISTSSQKGEWSYCMNNPDGTMGNGQFTHAFIESIIKEASVVSGTNAEWSSLFDRAYQKANQNTQSLVNQNGKRGQSGFNVIRIKY